jgi:hypothetical protein
MAISPCRRRPASCFTVLGISAIGCLIVPGRKTPILRRESARSSFLSSSRRVQHSPPARSGRRKPHPCRHPEPRAFSRKSSPSATTFSRREHRSTLPSIPRAGARGSRGLWPDPGLTLACGLDCLLFAERVSSLGSVEILFAVDGWVPAVVRRQDLGGPGGPDRVGGGGWPAGRGMAGWVSGRVAGGQGACPDAAGALAGRQFLVPALYRTCTK